MLIVTAMFTMSVSFGILEITDQKWTIRYLPQQWTGNIHFYSAIFFFVLAVCTLILTPYKARMLTCDINEKLEKKL